MHQKRLGDLLRQRREDAALEVTELASRVGMSRDVLGKYERAVRIHPLDPEYANAIATELKNVSVLEIVTAMGYQVAIAGLSADELALMDQYRRLNRAGRLTLQGVARALHEQLADVESGSS